MPPMRDLWVYTAAFLLSARLAQATAYNLPARVGQLFGVTL
jgi:hypothetical protein